MHHYYKEFKIKRFGKGGEANMVSCFPHAVDEAAFHLIARAEGAKLVMGDDMGCPADTEEPAHILAKKFLPCAWMRRGEDDGKTESGNHIDIPIGNHKNEDGDYSLCLRVESKSFKKLKEAIAEAEKMMKRSAE